ncbi:MAG: DNA polymerase III subunit delta' [Archangium sp.]|nr:DNA polymerase III subunit delta' [Archangium sp.]
MTLAAVQGQTRAVEALQAALAKKQVHHAWLFHGPDGVGKELAAAGLAQALVCEKQPFVGCGTCAACARVTNRNHPDVTWVMPEAEQVERGIAGRSDFTNTPSRDIRIEQVRKLQERLAFRALEAPHKIALLVTAHAMNQSAQNALLKTLEEPPRDTILILISAAPDKLLPTIRSRCAKAAFGPLSLEFIAEQVKQRSTKKGKKGEPATTIDDALALQIAKMSSGSLARALSFDPKTLTRRKELIESFEKLVPNDASGWLSLAETLAEDRDTAEAAIDVLQVWFRDVAIAQVGGDAFVNSDLAELAFKAAPRVSPAGLQRRTVVLDEAKNAITQRNGAVRLQLERMFIEMFAA